MILKIPEYGSRGDEFSFLRDIQIKTDVRVDSFTTVRPMTAKFGMQVHIEDLTHLRLGNSDVIALKLRDFENLL